MTDFDLDYRDLFEAGRRRFWDYARDIVRTECPEYFELLEKGGASDAYFEPFVHANVADSSTVFPHAQFLFGYVPAALRPRSVKVRTDDEGTVYVPRIGFFE